MTKERRIAIEMWKYVRDHYPPENEDNEAYLHNLKAGFLYEHGITHWAFHCWFCQYIAKRNKPGRRYILTGCRNCPLGGCDQGPYMRLCMTSSKQIWAEACDEIIIALGGEV